MLDRCWMWLRLLTHQTLFSSSCPSWRTTASREQSAQRESTTLSQSSLVSEGLRKKMLGFILTDKSFAGRQICRKGFSQVNIEGKLWHDFCLLKKTSLHLCTSAHQSLEAPKCSGYFCFSAHCKSNFIMINWRGGHRKCPRGRLCEKDRTSVISMTTKYSAWCGSTQLGDGLFDSTKWMISFYWGNKKANVNELKEKFRTRQISWGRSLWRCS